MIPTHGLTHIALAVADLDRSAAFYRRVFGMVEVFSEEGFIQLQTPDSKDGVVLELDPSRAGAAGGVGHFGFRLRDPADIEGAAAEVQAGGGEVLRRGEFCPGEPYLFARDPDGYEVEIWFELPTPVDPERGFPLG
jgi:catechol 2,3-dioxygenase-like lactoylglutathione lyase family enzyme